MYATPQDNERIGHLTQGLDRVGLTDAQSCLVLPIDICDTIFEFAPKPTLLACSCVSRAWREAARPHLFRALKILRDGPGSYDDFLQFLDENADIARYIRDLTLGYAAPPYPETSKNFVPVDTRPVVRRRFLVTLVEKLPRLEELRLSGILLDGPDPSHTAVTLPLATSTSEGARCTAPAIADGSKLGSFRLKWFLIVDCRSVGSNACYIPTLVDILSAVPADTVQMRDVYISFSLRHSLGQIKSIPEGQLDVCALFMDANPFRAERQIRYLYDALRRAFAPRCLRRLRLDYMDRTSNSGLRSLGEIIRRAGGDALRDLELPFVIDGPVGLSEDTQEHWSVLHLDECRNLEALKISLRLDKHGPVPRVPYSAVCNAILAHISPTLRRLTITLLLVYGDEQIGCSQTVCLGALDDVLEGRFPGLEVVQLEMQARGILKVTQWRFV
ncbi:hypothetical protein C8Q70DRAFT_302078 [Cubamyces menziesii]|nr:hypothetical protein C8Q70DRAFT_302078 [Cubamyces menziesii]